MALVDHEPAPKYESRTGCSLGKLHNAMSEDDQLTLGVWLNHRPDLSNRAIAEALRAEYPGWQGSHQTVQRHRSGSCGCTKADQ